LWNSKKTTKQWTQHQNNANTQSYACCLHPPHMHALANTTLL
jgi:hypothetical protein